MVCNAGKQMRQHPHGGNEQKRTEEIKEKCTNNSRNNNDDNNSDYNNTKRPAREPWPRPSAPRESNHLILSEPLRSAF